MSSELRESFDTPRNTDILKFSGTSNVSRERLPPRPWCLGHMWPVPGSRARTSGRGLPVQPSTAPRGPRVTHS